MKRKKEPGKGNRIFFKNSANFSFKLEKLHLSLNVRALLLVVFEIALVYLILKLIL